MVGRGVYKGVLSGQRVIYRLALTGETMEYFRQILRFIGLYDETRVDFLTSLPHELAIMIIRLLDDSTIRLAGIVCHTWRDIFNYELTRRESAARKTRAKKKPICKKNINIDKIYYDKDAEELHRLHLNTYRSECMKIKTPKSIKHVRFL